MAPALRIPVSVSMDQFNDQMGKMGDTTSRVVKLARNEFIKLNKEIAVEGVKGLVAFGGAAAGAAVKVGALQAAMRLATRAAGPIAAIFLIVEAFQKMGDILEFAKKKIEEYAEISNKALAAGVSSDFFQRFIKGGEELKLSLDDATAALTRFAAASKDKLGGSDLGKRIEELKSYGNLQGNTGVAAFGAAIGSEDKLRTFVGLIDQMLQKGERLAALDLAEKAFGSKVADNLRADAGYLDKMLVTAAKVSEQKLISQDDINSAVDLKNRMDEAQKILAEKWLPVQKDITKLGMQYQENWVEFYQTLASAVGYAQQLYDAIKGIPGVLREAGSAPFWTQLNTWMEQRGLMTRPEGLIKKGEPGFELVESSPAQQALASSLKNPALIKQAMEQTTAIQTAVRGDISKPKPPPTVTKEETDNLAAANDQIEKHIGLMNADAEAVGYGAAKREELRTVSLLETAAAKDGVVVTEELKLAMQTLGEEAGKAKQKFVDATDALHRINQASQIVGSAVSSAFADAIIEGKKLDEVLKSLVNTLLKAALNATIMSVFTPGAGGGKSPIATAFGFAGGTDFAPGGLALVGERGPELVNLPRGSQVIPNDVMRQGNLGNQSIIYSPAIDARGASVEAVARLAQIIEQDRAAFASRTVMTIQTARRNRIPGV